MHLEYISHSCFVICTNGKSIAFDPWITGSAYYNQWQLYPKPIDTKLVENADIILISHGHEDHFHTESLKRISKNAHVFFPFQWRAGVTDYLRYLTFSQITEAISFKTYTLGDIKITYLGYSLESVIVVECEGIVLVNINDALNSNHETAVDFLLAKIKAQWPKIDFLLSGWSGAGYFPNKVHFKGKDDVEVARVREQYFADNFCRFTKYLQPEIAIAFAPGFVLLTDENRWINEIKFPRTNVEKYYSENFEKESGIQFPLTYPGDYFTDKIFHKKSKYHKGKGDTEIYNNINEVFAIQIIAANEIKWIEEDEMALLINKLSYWLNKNKSLYHSVVLKDAKFSIRLKDVQQNNYLNVFMKGNTFKINRNNNPCTDDRLIIKTKALLLSKNLDKVWGGDILSIGYGIDIEVFDERSLEKNLDIVCVRLISRYPIFKDDVIDNAARVMKYYFNNPSLTNLWINQKIKLRPYVNKYPFNERDHWISFNKCDLCRVCNLPELDFEKLSDKINF